MLCHRRAPTNGCTASHPAADLGSGHFCVAGQQLSCLDEDYPSRTALITQALWRAKRRKEADDDLRAFLAIEAAGMSDEDREQLEWLRTRDYPDMGEPSGVLDPQAGQRSA